MTHWSHASGHVAINCDANGTKCHVDRSFPLNGPLNTWRKKAFSYWLHQSLNKNVLLFFFLLFFKSVNLKLYMFEWYFQKEKTRKRKPKQILFLFYGDLWNLESWIDIFTAMTKRRCWVSLPGSFTSLFSGFHQMLFKKAACMWKHSVKQHKGTIRKGGSWKKCICVDCSRHYRLFNDCPPKMKYSWCIYSIP